MSKDNLKVRVSKTTAIEKIRKFYVQATKKQVTLDEVTKLIEEKKFLITALPNSLKKRD